MRLKEVLLSISTTNNVTLVTVTPDAEKIIGYCARVSNPKNQNNKNVAGLLKYCIKHGHWSIFEMANMVIEINTTRDISAQIIRHRSFSFQEFSQRYAEATDVEFSEPRRQDNKNRQNSFDDLPEDIKLWWQENQATSYGYAQKIYKEALQKGIAKECARKILPMNTKTKVYMNGTIRSWMHYFNLRCAPETQLEHREIACSIRDIFKEQLPIIGELI
jgi:thymidylate synthase (FAD)